MECSSLIVYFLTQLVFLNYHLNFLKSLFWSSLVALWVRDLVLSLLWLELLVWRGFDPWPRNHCLQWVWPKTKKKKTKPLSHFNSKLFTNFILSLPLALSCFALFITAKLSESCLRWLYISVSSPAIFFCLFLSPQFH